MSEQLSFSYDQLMEFFVPVEEKFGLSTEQARIMADSMIFAQSRGFASHGVIRLPLYMTKVEKGLINMKAEMPFTMEQGAVASLDAQNCFGQLAGYKANEKAIELAKKYGISHVTVANSNHFGTGAWYSMRAADQGMVGINLSNASPAMPPFGAREPILGTNPVGVAIPCGKKHKPIVLDMALSVVARGKIRVYEVNGKKVPIGWGVDAEGKDTDDPSAILKGGALCPVGGVKGSAMAFIVDLLCGVMTKTGLTGDTKGITDMSGTSYTAHTFTCIDISKFIDLDEFGAMADECVDRLKALTPVQPGGTIYMAGEIEYGLMDKYAKEGIPVDAPIVDQLNDLAKKVGCPTL